MNKKYNYAPGLPGYGLKGEKGGKGKDGQSLYYCPFNLNISSNKNEALQKIKDNLSLVDGQPLIDKSYNANDNILDSEGNIFTINNLINDIIFIGNISTSAYFSQSGVTGNNYNRIYNKFDKGYMVDNIMTNNQNLNYTQGECYNNILGNFNNINYNDINNDDKNLFTVFTNGSNTIGLIYDKKANAFRLGNQDKSENLQFDFKNIIIGNNSPVDVSGAVLTTDNINCPVLYGNQNSIGELNYVPPEGSSSAQITWKINDEFWNKYISEPLENTSLEINIVQNINPSDGIVFDEYTPTNVVYNIDKQSDSLPIKGLLASPVNYKMYFKVFNNGWNRIFDLKNFNSLKEYLIFFEKNIVNVNSNSSVNVDLNYNIDWKISVNGANIASVDPSYGVYEPGESSSVLETKQLQINASENLGFETLSNYIKAYNDEKQVNTTLTVNVLGRQSLQQNFLSPVSQIINAGTKQNPDFYYLGGVFSGDNITELKLCNINYDSELNYKEITINNNYFQTLLNNVAIKLDYNNVDDNGRLHFAILLKSLTSNYGNKEDHIYKLLLNKGNTSVTPTLIKKVTRIPSKFPYTYILDMCADKRYNNLSIYYGEYNSYDYPSSSGLPSEAVYLNIRRYDKADNDTVLFPVTFTRTSTDISELNEFFIFFDRVKNIPLISYKATRRKKASDAWYEPWVESYLYCSWLLAAGPIIQTYYIRNQIPINDQLSYYSGQLISKLTKDNDNQSDVMDDLVVFEDDSLFSEQVTLNFKDKNNSPIIIDLNNFIYGTKDLTSILSFDKTQNKFFMNLSNYNDYKYSLAYSEEINDVKKTIEFKLMDYSLFQKNKANVSLDSNYITFGEQNSLYLSEPYSFQNYTIYWANKNIINKNLNEGAREAVLVRNTNTIGTPNKSFFKIRSLNFPGKGSIIYNLLQPYIILTNYGANIYSNDFMPIAIEYSNIMNLPMFLIKNN